MVPKQKKHKTRCFFYTGDGNGFFFLSYGRFCLMGSIPISALFILFGERVSITDGSGYCSPYHLFLNYVHPFLLYEEKGGHYSIIGLVRLPCKQLIPVRIRVVAFFIFFMKSIK